MDIFWTKNAKLECFITELKKVGYSEEKASEFVYKNEDYVIEVVNYLERKMKKEGYTEDGDYSVETIDEMDEWRYNQIHLLCKELKEHPFTLELVPSTIPYFQS